MKTNRRKFLAAAGTGGLLGSLGIGPDRAAAEDGEAKQYDRISTTICPYCAVGCGALVMSETLSEKDADGRTRRVVHVEGDPDHPINEGTLCPKGAAIYQLANNEKRLKQVLHRAPGQSDFKPIAWEDAARRIAQHIKETRDRTFQTENELGQTVNRTTAIASVGSAALDNEECWLYQGMLRAAGLVHIEHQARI